MIRFVARKCNFESGHIPDAQVGYLNKKKIIKMCSDSSFQMSIRRKSPFAFNMMRVDPDRVDADRVDADGVDADGVQLSSFLFKKYPIKSVELLFFVYL